MSIKCPNCSTNNGVTNKFCRECGLKLESDEQIVEEQAAPAQAAVVQPDEVNLGEELFSIMRLYDNGDLESAEERVCKIIESNPNSASAHSIRALIYERKGDNESANGNDDIAQDYLGKAIQDYEAIMALNPNSAADRGKLAMLKLKLAGKRGESTAVPGEILRSSKPKNKFLEMASKIPAPILAAVCAFIVLLVFFSFLIPRGEPNTRRASNNPSAQTPEGKVQLTATPNSGGPEENTYNVYTYPTPQQTPTVPAAPSTPSPTVPQVTRTTMTPAEKVKLPAATELVLVPDDSKPAPKPPKPDASVKPKPTPTESAPPAVERDTPEGSTLLKEAVDLKNQGRYAEAIQIARQSIQSYQSDLSAGRNVTEARRGIDNANRCISICQTSLNE